MAQRRWIIAVLYVVVFSLGITIPASAGSNDDHSLTDGNSTQFTAPYEGPAPTLTPSQELSNKETSPVLPAPVTTYVSPIGNATLPSTALPNSPATPQQTSDGASESRNFALGGTPISGTTPQGGTLHITQPSTGNGSLATFRSLGGEGEGYLPLVGLSNGTAVITLILIRYWAMAYGETPNESDVVEDATPTVTAPLSTP